MGLRTAVFVVAVAFAALASAVAAEADDDTYILTPKMLGNFNPTTGLVLSSGTPDGKNVGYKAFDREQYNHVEMWCAKDDGCQPIELIFEFVDEKVRCNEYRLYVAEDIPVDQKPVSWTLQCEKGDSKPWTTLDTVTNFDWSETEVYKMVLDEDPTCWHYMLTITNPVDDEGGMTATISELELRAYGTPPPTPPHTPTPTPTASETPIPTPTVSETPIPTPTASETSIPTPTVSATPIPTPTASATPIRTPTEHAA